MEEPAAELSPLAQPGVADAGELPFRFPFEDGADGEVPRCDARVPDRPAESCLNSFIAAIHRQDDGHAAGQGAGAVAEGLDGQAAVPVQRERLVPVHGFQSGRGPALPAGAGVGLAGQAV